MFNFCPLQGALSESTASQSLLELDGGIKVLVDVGWDDTFDTEKLKALEKHVPTLSFILLTHATTSHLSAYAHCCKNLALFTRIPVYATRPVIDLGRNLHQNLYASTPAAATTIDRSSLSELSFSGPQAGTDDSSFLRQPPSAEEIARYFSLIQPIKYSQPLQPLASPFSPPLNGLTITAYNSGHSLGGTIWHIQHGLESIVYAVDWNQARENVFAGAAWLGGEHGGTDVIEQLRKPTALVCSSRMTPALPTNRRDAQLLDHIRACVARGGTVLIPVDSSARVLELSYLLERRWQEDAAKSSRGESTLQGAKLFLAGCNVSSTMKNARSMLEWMDDRIVQEFEAQADGNRAGNGDKNGSASGAAPPFDFRHLKILEKKGQIEKLFQQIAQEDTRTGRVILASDCSLNWGFSQSILQSLASDARNLLLLTEKPALSTAKAPSVARTLWEWWTEGKDSVTVESTNSDESLSQIDCRGRELVVSESRSEPLEGGELTMYQQWLATQRQLQATLQTTGATALEAAGDAPDDASSSSSESEASETEQQGKALNISTTMGQVSKHKVILSDQDLGIKVLLERKGVYDFDVRDKKGRERMLPFPIRRKRNDEYGEVIRPEDFLRAEERQDDDQDGPADGRLRRKDDTDLGKKRKWDDVNTNKKAERDSIRTIKTQAEREGSEDGPMVTTIETIGDDLDGLPDEPEEEPSGPKKLVVTKERLQVLLRLAFVDFSGLHDRRTLNMIIPLIQPRKLILISGSEEETMSLAADCRKHIGTADGGLLDVFTPAIGDIVDGSVDTNAWVVRLADPLVKRLKWQMVRGLGVVTISAQLLAEAMSPLTQLSTVKTIKETADEQEGSNKRLKLDNDATAVTIVPTLDIVPTSMIAATRVAARQPLHVGELRLADLRKASQTAGHTAEFRGEGTLLIDGSVAVRKNAAGQVELESIGLPMAAGSQGSLMGYQQQQQQRGAFQAVRRIIYENLAVVAGA